LFTRQCRKRVIGFTVASRLCDIDLKFQLLGGGLYVSGNGLSRWIVGVDEEGDKFYRGNQLVQ
jgi:hypothetical protein